MIYNWLGAEEPLGSPVFVVRALRITSFEEKSGVLVARGEIDTMDYIENCPSTYYWKAQGQKDSGTIKWEVLNAEERTFWVSREGRPMFTAAKVFDDGIEAFVKKHLDLYIAAPKDGRGAVVAEKSTIYTGPITPYTGPCVCGELARATTKEPFDWQARTKGKFPKKCFSCSCGRNWWEYHPEEGRWAPVPDHSAYEMLKLHNGEPQQQLVCLEDGFFLQQTIRDRGWIPIG